ncbi:MAG: hypothetical protein MJZ63_04220 [Muribaculaceae bacterium]|nr:hypothetical protein [Muribaculaceae bacterium]
MNNSHAYDANGNMTRDRNMGGMTAPPRLGHEGGAMAPSCASYRFAHSLAWS